MWYGLYHMSRQGAPRMGYLISCKRSKYSQFFQIVGFVKCFVYIDYTVTVNDILVLPCRSSYNLPKLYQHPLTVWASEQISCLSDSEADPWLLSSDL